MQLKKKEKDAGESEEEVQEEEEQEDVLCLHEIGWVPDLYSACLGCVMSWVTTPLYPSYDQVHVGKH